VGMHAPWFQVRSDHWLVHVGLGSAASGPSETAFASPSSGHCRKALPQITAPMRTLGRDDESSGHTGSSGAECEVKTSQSVGSTAREQRVLRSTTTGCAGKALKTREILWAAVTRNIVTRLGGIKPLKG
jgi:hypothetical protein